MNILWIYKKIKWFIQRGRRGWSDYDLLDLNCYVAEMMVSALAEMKKKTIGFPGDLSKMGTEAGFQEWLKILGKMIDGFDAYLKIQDMSHGEGKFEETRAVYVEGLNLFRKYFNDLWF